jgi:hypothetical protein
MKRYKIAPVMVVILYLAIGLGAILNPRDARIWESTIYTLTGFLVATATLLAFDRRGRERMKWTGFAVFGWGYLVLGFEAFSPAKRPDLLTTWVIKELVEWLNDMYVGTNRVRDPLRLETSLAVGHSIFALLCGLVGARLGSYLAAGDPPQRANARVDSSQDTSRNS